ncbi:MAG: hypothetical protein ACM3ME_07545 [Chloroflexota bacterium]|nr:hypothetical protein [Lentimicrobium sp.]
MKIKLTIIAFVLALTSLQVHAQHYRTGIGARLGYFNGITLKHFVSESNALEGIASFRWNGFIITGLYEWQKPIQGAKGLDYELGLGAHIGAWGDRSDPYWHKDDPFDDNSFTVVGVDFIAGLEYTFPEVPFNIALDWKPAFNFGGNRWWGDGLALSIRYTFK